MAAKATLQATITGNAAPFIAAVNSAQQRAQTFSARVQQLFRRTPELRAERALGQFAGSLAAGDIQGAITSVSHRLSGLGLAAGVGLGAAIIVFQKAKQQIDEVDKAVQRVNADLARPLSLQSALGPEGIGKEIETAKKDMDDLVEKRKGFFQRFSEAFRRGEAENFGGPQGIRAPTDPVSPAAKAQQSISERLKQLASARADAEVEVVRARIKGLKVSEEDGEVAKINLGYREKLAKLILERGPHGGPNISEARRALALQADRQLSIEAANQKADIRGRATAAEQDEANMALGLVNVDKQRIAHLQNQLGLIQDQLRFSTQLTSEERKRLQVDETKAKAAINQDRFTKFFQSPSDRLNESIQENRRQGAIKEFQRSGGLLDAHRDMSGNIISGIDPLTNKRVGPGGASQDKSEKPLTKTDLEEVMQKFWGG